MGNCLRRGEGSSDDYSLLRPHPADHDQMGNTPQAQGSASAATSRHHHSSHGGSSASASSYAGGFPDRPESSPDNSSNYTSSVVVERPLSEEEEMKLAQRHGLIQHLPSGLYDGGKKDRECPICMMELNCGDPVRFLPCMHVYHKDCIDDWLLKHSLTCPNCMEPVDSALLNSYEVGKTPWDYDS